MAEPTLFERRTRDVRPFAFPSREDAPRTESAIPWAVQPGESVRSVRFRPRGEGPVRAETEPPPPPPPPIEPPAEAAATPPPVEEEVAAEPRAESVPWLDLPPASSRPHPAMPPELGPLLPDPELEAKKVALGEAASALLRARANVLADVESELLELAVDIATVLVEDELASRPELHRALVRAALAAVEPSEGMKIRASRATYEALLEAFDSATVEHGARRVQVELDDTVEGLGAVVQASGARVDGRVHSRIETLKRALIDARRSRDVA